MFPVVVLHGPGADADAVGKDPPLHDVLFGQGVKAFCPGGFPDPEGGSYAGQNGLLESRDVIPEEPGVFQDLLPSPGQPPGDVPRNFGIGLHPVGVHDGGGAAREDRKDAVAPLLGDVALRPGLRHEGSDPVLGDGPGRFSVHAVHAEDQGSRLEFPPLGGKDGAGWGEGGEEGLSRSVDGYLRQDDRPAS